MTDTNLSEDHLIQLSAIRDEETDELFAAGHISQDDRWDASLNGTATFKYDEMTLHITPGPLYPVAPVSWDIVNHTMSIDAVDGLRRRLREIVQGTALENSPERFRIWFDQYDGTDFAYTKVATLLVEETVRQVEAFRAERMSRSPGRTPQLKGALPFEMKAGVDISTLSSSELAMRYFRKTPQEIAKLVPAGYRIQHMEEVLRKDLAIKFDNHREKLREDLSQLPIRTLRRYVPPELCHSNRLDDYVDHLSKPHITYHGTQRRFVTSIVQHGFLRPGMKNPATNREHGVRCGATYGRGIYSSPDPLFSLAYSDWWCTKTQPDEYFGLKLLVCATIMGRSRVLFREDNWRTQDHPYWGADSHVGNNNLEYIVFRPEQIIPVYVIHLDWGESNVDYFEDTPDDPSHWLTAQRHKKLHPKLDKEVQYAGDKQRAKAAVLAKAAKYFPYGFGPATGSKFIVEEVGEVSEDEEEYGEYQELRVQEKNHDLDSDYWSWEKYGEIEDGADIVREADEYGHQVRTYGPAWESIPLPGVEVTRGFEEDDEFCLEGMMKEAE
ncbi:parp domain-containing protein [Pochonia chlamydosporia 170]|uniref:Parp domain-containing protein n=1 Tax=Pochonia chlamydosporia 170 TaxID=1380566 RepID=A0A179F060_METCM|nr:parp domain-containing protein [Pochonia chlamydosporia 170]OAQ58811.1 parp domain-containing protein [Pochonia chlamydosporia 170]